MSSAAAHCSACCSARATDTASSSVRARSLLGRCSIHRGSAEGRGRAPLLGLPLLVGLEVVLEVNSGIERAIGLLRSVLDIDLRKRQANGLHTVAVAAVGVRHRGDDHVVHLDDEELLLAIPCLA